MGSVIAGLSLLAGISACASPPANERETGSGGQLVRYSSRQVSVDLTDAQRETLRQLRDHVFAETQQARILEAISRTLTKEGYAPVSVDTETGVVEAERNTVLVPKWRQIARGVLKSRIGALPAKPDHERMAVIVAVRSAQGEPGKPGDRGDRGERGDRVQQVERGSLVRVRFDRTVWDSNGDARTETVLEKDVYDGFFSALDLAVRAN
ncbi:hypothetical protein [Pandoraea norimbergensis]|uniref:hypothetical protein n=1 Tax=Pandoraea norimbergensis TaxID=93219 RepID=UPI001F40B312|nr:hypothetical protein [Pandoraea norimbergensis]